MKPHQELPTSSELARDRKALIFVLAVSAIAVLFLFWLIYFKGKVTGQVPPLWTESLPGFNASLNALSAISLISAFFAIRRKAYEQHGRLMLAAFLFSSIFLVSYITYYALHGNTIFRGEGPVRAVYFFVLITHILMSIVTLPLVLQTFYFALSRRWDRHKAWAVVTLPLWLYVSVTGVLVFLLQRVFNPALPL